MRRAGYREPRTKTMYRCVGAAAITLAHTPMPLAARSGAAGGGAAGAAATSGLIRLLPWRLGPARQLTASWLSAGGSNGLLPSRTAFASMKPTTTGDGTTSGSCSALEPTLPITRSGRGSWARRDSGRATRRGWLLGVWCSRRRAARAASPAPRCHRPLPAVTTASAARRNGTLGRLRKNGMRRVRMAKITRVVRPTDRLLSGEHLRHLLASR